MVEVSVVVVVGTVQVGDRNMTGSVSVCVGAVEDFSEVGAGADLRGYIFRVGVGMVDLDLGLGLLVVVEVGDLGMGMGVGAGVWDL